MNIYEQLLKAIKKHSGLTNREIIDAGILGAEAGWTGFTYITDAVKFYAKNENLIWELLYQTKEEIGYKSIPELIATFRRQDMTETPDHFKTLLSWFALEEVGRWLKAKKGEKYD